MLRGLVHCGICERKMQGNQAHGTLRYRCTTTQSRALPLYLSHHPKAVYVREDAIVNALDAWLPTLADPEWLASTQSQRSQSKHDTPACGRGLRGSTRPPPTS